MGQFEKALRDAKKAVSKNAEWAKGYYRMGLALQELAKKDPKAFSIDEAYAAFQQAAKKAPSDKVCCTVRSFCLQLKCPCSGFCGGR